jgi:hypothetical protein
MEPENVTVSHNVQHGTNEKHSAILKPKSGPKKGVKQINRYLINRKMAKALCKELGVRLGADYYESLSDVIKIRIMSAAAKVKNEDRLVIGVEDM